MSQEYQIGNGYFADDNTTYSELTSYLFEDEEYDMVRVFEKTDSKRTFKKLIIAKDIVQLEKKTNLQKISLSCMFLKLPI